MSETIVRPGWGLTGPLALRFRRLRPDAILPAKARHDDDAGWDLAWGGGEGVATLIRPGQTATLDLGIAWECAPGWYAQVRDRSSLAALGVAVRGGVIDCSYRGAWRVLLRNESAKDFGVWPGDRIAQFVLLPVPTAVVVEADSLSETARGAGGFGSTGGGTS